MQIDYKENYSRFKDLKEGDCFVFIQTYYMKTEPSQINGHLVNAVNLKNGCLIVVDDDAKITYVNLKCVNADHTK